jgi:hypothetical protein
MADDPTRAGGPGDPARNAPGATASAQADRLLRQLASATRAAAADIRRAERAYRLGAIGERKVGRILENLDRPWRVLHDIALNDRGRNLDHLVIGPSGVFCLNTKHYPGAEVTVTQRTFRVRGRRWPHLAVSAHERDTIARSLRRVTGRPIRVTPMVVLVGARLDVRAAPDDVDVVAGDELLARLGELPARISDDEIEALALVAQRRSTWTPRALTVRPWARWGHRRTYVNAADGTALGYRDDVTGIVHCLDPADLGAVTDALRTH